MLRRSSSSSNVLRKAPPPHLQLNMKSTHRPDVHPSQLHLSSADLSKVNAYFAASMSDTTLSVHSSHSTLGKNSPLATPRSPGGTVIPPNLFAPGHLVDRGQLLEQIQRKRAAMDSGADVVDPMLRVLRLEHKRPLSLVPELVEGLEEEAQDLEVISVDDALAIMYPDLDVAVHEFEQEMTETPDLYFVIDPGWEISLGSEVTCCFIDDPFPQDVPVARYADAFTHFSDRSENDDYGVPFDISESTEE
ncbi:hypothetical protein L218DRAFT_962617 [Marasmius fiardii PR-910]|nr:hypothetical protein L218DRAFT_962617 [Marasmius fiardii PR-910]